MTSRLFSWKFPILTDEHVAVGSHLPNTSLTWRKLLSLCDMKTYKIEEDESLYTITALMTLMTIDAIGTMMMIVRVMIMMTMMMMKRRLWRFNYRKVDNYD